MAFDFLFRYYKDIGIVAGMATSLVAIWHTGDPIEHKIAQSGLLVGTTLIAIFRDKPGSQAAS